MNQFDCLIIRHRRENLRKCSLRGLESRENFAWATYPLTSQGLLGFDISACLLLHVEGELLSDKDTSPLILLDATWRYAAKMRIGIPELQGLPKRRIPDCWRTAYPRYQTECPDPERGLASIEALFIAFLLTGRSTDGLLDTYYWKEAFFEKNHSFLSKAS